MVSDSVVLISAFPSPLRPASAATTILAVAGHVEHVEHVANAHHAFPAVPHRVPVGVADPVHLQEEKVGHWLVNRGLLPQRGLGSRRTRTDAQFSRFFDGVDSCSFYVLVGDLKLGGYRFGRAGGLQGWPIVPSHPSYVV